MHCMCHLPPLTFMCCENKCNCETHLISPHHIFVVPQHNARETRDAVEGQPYTDIVHCNCWRYCPMMFIGDSRCRCFFWNQTKRATQTRASVRLCFANVWRPSNSSTSPTGRYSKKIFRTSSRICCCIRCWWPWRTKKKIIAIRSPPPVMKPP